MGAESFLGLPRRLGIAQAEVDSCGGTLSLVLVALKEVHGSTDGFLLLLMGIAILTLEAEVEEFSDSENSFGRVASPEEPEGL